ncbi:MAG: hypothetical protein LBV27_06210 [Oscillospiraceae bacterium]|jgi:hypothetical protein|nr:hypothetical protein [Oscillospiraceae bacterium]
MKTAVRPEERVQQLTDSLDNASFANTAEVEKFYCEWMELVWDYKIPSKLFDFYAPNIHVYRENGDDLEGIQAVVQDVMVVEAAFPDVTMHVEAVVCVGNPEDGYELFARRYLNGTNLGYSRYGAPTERVLDDTCMSLDMLKFEKIDGRWQVVQEHLNQSTRTIRVAMGGPYER